MTDTVTQASGSDFRNRLAVLAAACMFGITYGLASPLIALELHRRGYGETLIGLNAAMQALGILTVAMLLPRLAVRWGLRRVLLGGLVLAGLAMLSFPALGWLWIWFALRFLLGIGSEGVLVTTESWISQSSREVSRATNMAIYTAMVSLGFAIGPLILGHVGTGDAMPFWLGAALIAVAVLVVAKDRTPPPLFEAAEPLPGGLPGLLRHAPIALAATALNAALETAGLTFLPVYAMKLGWTEVGATRLLSTLLVGAIVLQIPIGWLGDRLDRRKLVLILACLATIGALCWPFAIAVPWLAHALLFAWGGAFVGIYTLMMTIVGSRYRGGQLVAVYAGMSVAFGVGALLGPMLSGLAMEATRHGLPLFAAIACAAFALFAGKSRAPA